MRIRLIVIAVTAALAGGGFSAYAANHGSTVSNFARTTTLEGAVRGDAVSDVARAHGALRSATFRTGAPKTKGDAKESTACEAAENALAALGSAGRTEDKAEHSATATAARASDRTEDQAERTTADTVRDSVQGACHPKRSRTAACTAAIDALNILAAADRTEDQAEVRPTTAAAKAADRTEDMAERQGFMAAIRAISTACAGSQR